MNLPAPHLEIQTAAGGDYNYVLVDAPVYWMQVRLSVGWLAGSWFISTNNESSPASNGWSNASKPIQGLGRLPKAALPLVAQTSDFSASCPDYGICQIESAWIFWGGCYGPSGELYSQFALDTCIGNDDGNLIVRKTNCLFLE